MLIDSVPTVLIPAWQQARRSRKRRGSVACTAKSRRSGTIRSQPSARVSHIWLGCIFPKTRPSGAQLVTQCHTMVKVAFRLLPAHVAGALDSQRSRRTSNEGVNGVKSQPKYDVCSHDVNMGSPTLVLPVQSAYQNGDGAPIVPNSWPVMGSAVGNQSDRSDKYKLLATAAKACAAGGKWSSLCIQFIARKEDC